VPWKTVPRSRQRLCPFNAGPALSHSTLTTREGTGGWGGGGVCLWGWMIAALYKAYMHRSPSEVTVSTGVSGADDFVSCLNSDFGSRASPPKMLETFAAEERPDQRLAAVGSRDTGIGRLHVGGSGMASPPVREGGGEREHAIQLGTAAPGAETIERLKRQLDVANAGLVIAGVVVVAMCIVSRDRFW
jgi:hypothetical protein